MDSISSFSVSPRGNQFVVDVRNLVDNKDAIFFCFDTGAVVSLIGLNTVCRDNQKDCDLLKKIIETEIAKKQITGFETKSVSLQSMTLYPCKCKDVSISGTKGATFYFYIYLEKVGTALLGYDFINGCSFTHKIGDAIQITAIQSNYAARFYPKKVLDFHEIMQKYKKVKDK